MSLTRRHLVLAALGLAAAASAGCTITAEIPQIQARELRFTGVDPAGLTFQVDFIAFNTNNFTLDLHDLRAHMIIEGQDLGSTVTAVSAQLPTGRWTPVTATMTLPWNGVPASLLVASGAPTLNYVLQGEVTVDHYVSIRAPFETRGTVPRDFFMRGATSTINNVINSVLPGFGNLQ
ncbi:MAG: hypothetical protein JWM10_5225 [Myxococcaceae bacterium]|nr:hypothetical protein [Myxococcaceae bacterium]